MNHYQPSIEVMALIASAFIVLFTIVAQAVRLSTSAGTAYVLSGRGDASKEQDPVYRRLTAAVRNGIESLVVFAALVVGGTLAGAFDGATSTAAVVFLAGRALHPVLYAVNAVPLRSMAWTASFMALCFMGGRVAYNWWAA